jgi:cell division protein FtsA
MAQDLSVGVDVGSHQIKVVAVGKTGSRDLPQIKGTGFAKSKGLRQGHPVDPSAVTEQANAAIQQASESAGQQLNNMHAAISGSSLTGRHAVGSMEFDNDNHTITESDIASVIAAAENSLTDQFEKNHTILHTFPLAFKVDGRTTMSKPTGMKGGKLAVRTFFIAAMSQHIYDLVAALEDTGVTIDNVVAGPLAASKVTLSEAQKIAGCVHADIGSETVSIIVFDDNKPVSLQVFPIGSTDITNDIALGLKIPLKEAEQIKLDSTADEDIPDQQLENIINARLTDMFELIEDHLESINRRGLLPAGIIITGGGAGIAMIDDIAKSTLDLPSERARVKMPKTKVINGLENSAWSVAYGTATYAIHDQPSGFLPSIRSSKIILMDWIKQFLP